MRTHRGVVGAPDHDGFEFDYNHNAIYFSGKVIHLSPHEADILRILLNNRARPTSINTLIQSIYRADEPASAAVSVRVAIHSLRRKIEETGMSIKAEPKIGYELNASHLPELNRRLTDKILTALDLARDSGETEIVKTLEAALFLAEAKRQRWRNRSRPMASSEAPLMSKAS
ncbi:MAG: Transcriptional regulatory protein terminal [Rhodospirillales bacterium]|nr:Transcriptional regulatory protein terminal [Rhodospirillales bacterium]